MSKPEKPQLVKLTTKVIDEWANDPTGPVALTMRQRLLSVEGDDGEDQIIYPPTFADVGYNIDTLADGTKVALIDSVGSQANRLEPAFKADSGHVLSKVVPQINIALPPKPCLQCEPCLNAKKNPSAKNCEQPWVEKRSLFELAHRAADAIVQSSPTLGPVVAKAFDELHRTGSTMRLATIAPTSLIFGCWDSRGDSGEKRPRLIRSIIRAWDVDVLYSSAQFNSISKSLSEEQQEELENEAKKKKKKLSNAGLADAPAVFRKVSTRASTSMPEFTKNGINPDRRVLGGVVVRDGIERHVTINLVALRGIIGPNEEETATLRKYLLALSLLTATTEIDMFLREGCNLRIADANDEWRIVPRRGEKTPVDLSSDDAQKLLNEYAESAYKPFKTAREELELGTEHEFDLKAAKELLGKTTDEEEETS